MHRCSCSTKALETCVRNVAGIDIRQQRAQHFFQLYRRSLGTRSSLRQVQSTGFGSVEDDFVPFESALAKPQLTIQRDAASKLKPGGHGATPPPKVEEEADVVDAAEWHAEVEIASSETVAMAEEAFGAPDTVDAVSMPRHGLSSPHDGTGSGMLVLDLPALSQHVLVDNTAAVSPSGSGQTKAENRKSRKLRRIKAGTFKPTAIERPAGEVDTDEFGVTGAPLKRIESLEVPSTIKAVNKSDQSSTTNKHASSRSTPRTNKEDKASTLNRPTQQPSKRKKEPWQIQKAALDSKFAEQGWQPRKRLSPDTLEGIRALHASDPATYTTATLANHFQITPEAIRRILKSKWRPNPEEIEDRMKRWEKRGVRKWEEMSAAGSKPPKKWRELGVKNPLLERKKAAAPRLTKTSNDLQWKQAQELADRLPFEGSFV